MNRTQKYLFISIGLLFIGIFPVAGLAQIVPPPAGGGRDITSRTRLYERDFEVDPVGEAFTEYYNAQRFGVFAAILAPNPNDPLDLPPLGGAEAYITIYSWIDAPSAGYVDFRLTLRLTGYMNDGFDQDNLFKITGEIRDASPDTQLFKKEDTNIQWDNQFYTFLLSNQYAYSGYNEVYFKFKVSVYSGGVRSVPRVSLRNLGIQIIQVWSSV